MYLLEFTLDNLSLMALTIATGSPFDDAIVVIENITRHIENGMKPRQAALKKGEGDWFYGALHEHLPKRAHPT